MNYSLYKKSQWKRKIYAVNLGLQWGSDLKRFTTNQNKLQIINNNIKTTCKIIKESIGKSKVFLKDFPKILRLNKISITDKKVILDIFIKFFINISSIC